MAAVDPHAPDLLEGLSSLAIDEVRARRAACQDHETQLSYVRRLAQGRLDIVRHERARRSAGGAPAEVEKMLTAALADHITAPGNGHLPTVMGPGDVDRSLLAALDEAAGPTALSDPSAVGDDELQRALDGLTAFERDVSVRRKAMFERIDALQEELVRRYRSGEASVDSLLKPGT